MGGTKVEFEGAPCLQHTSYMFYKAFKYKSDNQIKILTLGDFFFLKILEEIPVCIGEIELLWEDKASNQLLASLRLYFRPEHTPDGRQDDTGEDEVVALGERLVLRLDDLIPLIQPDVKWLYGSSTHCCDRNKEAQDGSRQEGCEKLKQVGDNIGSKDGCDSLKNGVVLKEENGKRNTSAAVVKMEHLESEIDQSNSGAANLAVMSYPKYCRYRAMRKRLEGCENEWLHLAVVVAIGGFSGKAPGCRVMFCRDTFYQAEIDDLDFRMDHMLPILKGRTKGKKSKQLTKKDSVQDSDSMDEMFANVTPSISTSSRPRRSTESSEINEEKVSTEEQAFLIGLHKFMHDAKMPIGRIPSLGFKQIDLFYFYKQAEKLGGYDSITHKRMWKHLYDKLGGNSSNTSAATCTRKHYERLLLPYERHLRKLKLGKSKKKHKHLEEEEEEETQEEENVKEGREDNGHSSHVENVEVKEEREVKKEVIEPETKEDSMRILSVSDSCLKNESMTRKDRVIPASKEHSKPDFQGDSEVLEIPLRHRGHNSSAFHNVDPKVGDGNTNFQNLTLAQIDQLRQQQMLKSSESLTSALPPGAIIPGESGLPFVYHTGYLVPVLPQHMLQAPWGMLTPPVSSPSASSPQIRVDGSTSQSGTTSKDPSMSALPSSSKTNQNLGHNTTLNQDTRSKPFTGKLPPSVQVYQQPSTSNSTSMKEAHTNSYKPAPYLLNDHIQPVRKNVRSSYHFSPNDLLGNSSHTLAPLLHPRPPGHRTQPHLPPAPSAIYLHPASTDPFSPLRSPITSSPPLAHHRKRPYPFENPTLPSTNVFPSPDIVLDRIRNSTGLPRSHAALANPSSIRQRFEDPRQIFRQTPQSFAANQNAVSSPRKDYMLQQQQQQQQELLNSRHLNSKSRNSGRKPLGTYAAYSYLPVPELQQALLQQQHGIIPPGSKGVDSFKSTNNSNGLLSVQQVSKVMPPVQQTSPVASSSKDVRLTSALFGTQFTASPRTTKPSELPSPQSLMVDTSSAAAAAMSLNPHLHPAFMSPYLPSGGTTAAASAMNPQLQMYANAYATTPAQLAAYEEILRQNGYGALFSGGGQQAKGTKKN